MNRLATILATSGGAGYVPVAPGTAGSAVGVGIYLLAADRGVVTLGVLTALITLAGIWAADRAIVLFSNRDPGPVVIDEVAGQLVALLGTGADWTGALAGFLLFRAFDIIKPWPVGRLEALPGGVGIMADDLMAGLYANLVLQVLLVVLPGLF
ncbi:MAG TPA: phosphatidylglycerophosphatase A [Vicinamibacterales bacterium]|nr:phosphatidylglycerophosphatase A [Vicinamibacterales bacterium]